MDPLWVEQVRALLDRGLARSLREALLVGLGRRLGRRLRRSARFGQGTAGPQTAAQGVAEASDVDAEALQQYLEGLRVGRRLDGLRLVDVREVQLQIEVQRIGSPRSGRGLQLEADLQAPQDLVRLSRVDVDVSRLDRLIEPVELAGVDRAARVPRMRRDRLQVIDQ